MIECGVWWAVPLTAEPRYLELLDSLEQGRYQAYRQEIDRRRFLTGRVLAKTVVGELLGRAPESVTFDATCDDCGKPHGRPRIDGVTFSISHSGQRIGLAVTSEAPVGLDVETADRKAADSLISYALNETEQQDLAGLGAEERVRAFFRYWTRKEALMKATGRGLKIPLQSITLSGPGEPARLVASADSSLAPETTQLADLEPGDGYRAAVAILAADEIKVTERRWEPSRE
ncbi:MAG TPA: 4'-phosphopantetheinyl transferase superfamily protein [Amycolatopsis sp.]|uniref:4'-phosphopantetheinyl transferase family protein n=1 Tax=Amycolatopsis sp. TaxID=37632 RepID=UPI002B4A0B04|nr:4'-phosphopantetheinyl transferase superfamily protein [Amycolatopsis sp.]HKS45241.1 4'-phosphopantetheinyl transferase superfamily protein [Amycolatopsis sp.]